MNRFFLSFELIDSPLLLISALIAAVGVVAVLFWPPRHLLRALLIGVSAGLVTYIVVHILEGGDVFQGPLPVHAATWASAGVAAAAVGVVGICSRPWGRRIVGVITVLASLFAAALGVNASYGVTHNLAAILGVQATA